MKNFIKSIDKCKELWYNKKESGADESELDQIWYDSEEQLKANEYYDANDSIYNALVQYLFITDISYTLRKDDDLNITINNIKYQEKLLQSLVKLIR